MANRYNELKVILEAKKEELIEALAKYQAELRQNEGFVGDDVEQAQRASENDFITALNEMRRDSLAQVRIALARLERGDYGVCPDCESEIEVKRLKALPFAVRCIHCEGKSSGGRSNTTVIRRDGMVGLFLNPNR